MSAGWFNSTTPLGLILVGGAILKQNWGAAAFGLMIAVFGPWMAMRRLSSGPSARALAWVCVEGGIIAVAFGVALIVWDVWRLLAYAVIGVAVFAAPPAATRLTRVKEL